VTPRGWLWERWYDLNYAATMAAATVGWSLRFQGRGNLPPRGPVLLVANHQSYLDPVMIGLALRRRLCWLARKTLFKNPLFAAYLHSMNVVPVDQEGVAKEGLKAVLDRLKDGQTVLVFPEGHRTQTGRMKPLEAGVALLIKRSQAPVVPAGIAGSFESFSRDRMLPLLSPLFLPATAGAVGVAIGKPLDPARLNELPRQALLDTLFNEIQGMQRRAERLRRKP
jgi:1-acyl-sn-glycerol-3-phosphate acyltransferase